MTKSTGMRGDGGFVDIGKVLGNANDQSDPAWRHSMRGGLRGPSLEASGAELPHPIEPDSRIAPATPVEHAPRRAALTAEGAMGKCECDCGGTGWLVQRDGAHNERQRYTGHTQPTLVPCACRDRQRQEHAKELLFSASNLESYSNMTFNTFDSHVPGVGEAWRAARAFADNLQGWLVLLGNPGSGKTHLAAAIANHAIKLDLGVNFGVVPDMLHTFKVAFRNGVIGVANRERGHTREAFSVFGISGRYEHGHGHGHGHETTRGDDADYHALFERIRCASLLVLDDLGSEQDTPWARTEIYRLVNYRYQASLPTVITSNVDLDKLEGRLVSRMLDRRLCRLAYLDARDFRPNKERT